MPGPRSRTRITKAGAGPVSTRNSTRPPPAYWNALRAISEVAVAIRVWSSGGKPSSPAIWRARCRARTTSGFERGSPGSGAACSWRAPPSAVRAAKTVTSSRPRL